MKKISNTNLTFKTNNANVNNSQIKMNSLSSSQKNINDNIKKQNMNCTP